MKKAIAILPLLALSQTSLADTAYGTLSNFDAVNDTGKTCYGFEIEIDNIHSRDISYTYDFNHYGPPKISEDTSNASLPKVFVRYQGAIGSPTAFTNPAAPGAITPTNGHQCTNPSVNQGCEHFGVGYTGSPTAFKYNWLCDDGSGNIVLGPPVTVANPVWTYNPPVLQPNPDPNLPPLVQFPAQVVAAIPAPVAPVPAGKQYGEPSWVKVIKTTAHKAFPLALDELVSDDKNGDGLLDWTNGEAPEVESEFYLLQTNTKGDAKKSELAGNADSLGDNGDETVTRRYEFYSYAAGNLSIDGENGEALCDTVSPDGIHGVGTVTVTDSLGNEHDFDCSAAAIVGDYMGAQMGEFNAVAPFGLINSIQNASVGEIFPERTIPAGGNTPYSVSITHGALPNGLIIQQDTGILYGVPSKVGLFNFTVSVNDADTANASQNYTMKITGPGDLDNDADIDSADLTLIKAKYGQAVAENDPADLNGDLTVNVLDYRKAASLCTLPRCALVTPPTAQ